MNDEHMSKPEALTKDKSLFQSIGKGTDVWEIFVAAMTNDLSKIKSLLNKYLVFPFFETKHEELNDEFFG